MKRAYVRPTMVGERFVANEYVAACGDKGKVYKFKCDAGGGKSGNVYLETNGKEGLQLFDINNNDTYLSKYHACGTTHDANAADEFLDGYYVRGLTVTPVKVWRGEKGDNTHCTINLNIKDWGKRLNFRHGYKNPRPHFCNRSTLIIHI